MINYSLKLQSTVPGTVGGGPTKKVYAQAQSSGEMSLSQFARHIAGHGSTFDKGTIEGVISQAVECLREKLLEGYIVNLGDLGYFAISLRSKGSKTAADFTSENIKSVSVRWTPGAQFKNLMEDAEFQFVTTRAEQAASRKAAKAALDGDSNSGSGGGPNTDDSNGE